MLGAPDPELLAHCHTDGRVLVIQDRGFIRMHHQQHRHAGIAYSERGARTIGHLVASLALIHEVLGAEDMVGHVDFV